MSDDRTPPAQLAAGGATVPAGAGYAPAHQDDHDTDGGHDPAGKFVNAVQNFLAANKYKRDLDNVQVRGLAENMPPPPANIVTEWYAKSEEERRNPGHEKKSSGKDEAPPLHPVMIALLMQEARKKAEAAGKTAAGVLGADVIIDGRPDLDERKPAVEKKADWLDTVGKTVTYFPRKIYTHGLRPVVKNIASKGSNYSMGDAVTDVARMATSVPRGLAETAWNHGGRDMVQGAAREGGDFLYDNVAKPAGGQMLDRALSDPDLKGRVYGAVEKELGMGNGELQKYRDVFSRHKGGMSPEKLDRLLTTGGKIMDTVSDVTGWLGKDGLGLGGKNWHYILGGIGTLGLGYAGYKMMGSDSAPSNAHAAQQRGTVPRDPHSSEYEDMMIDMMMRRREQY